MVHIDELKPTIAALFAEGKGILAADESTDTIGKRFAKHSIENTEEHRRAYRELLFTAPGMEEYISGVIMHDETFRQKAGDGRRFPDILKEKRVLTGVKADLGIEDMPTSPLEKVTKGLEELSVRLHDYGQFGATFAKWRAVHLIGPGLPSDPNIRKNAKDLAMYARLCQEAGLVPIVEPEVLMDGAHDAEKCRIVTEAVLAALVEEMKNAGAWASGTIVKVNMVLAGEKYPEKTAPDQVGDATVKALKSVLPADIGGVVFLSGGQSELQATRNLEAIAERGLPMKFTFSFGRALQESAIEKWGGDDHNLEEAQKAFLHRAEMNSYAIRNIYGEAMEAI